MEQQTVQHAELLESCQQLLSEVAKQRYGTSLLQKTKNYLQSCLTYKSK